MYWALLVLNIFFACAWGFLRFWRHYVKYMRQKFTKETWEFYSQILTGFMLTVSFAILFYAIVKIRRFIVHNGLRNQINSRMVCLHVVCFGSYLLANIMLYVEIGFYSFRTTGEHAKVVMYIWILHQFLTFITEATMILIFLEIGKMKFLRNIGVLTSSPKT